MKSVLLIHDEMIQHYRVPIYGYLHAYLRDRGYDLVVVAEGIQKGYEGSVGFPLIRLKLGLGRLLKLISIRKPQACILFVNHSKPYYFPLLLFLKTTKLKVITWTHAVDLQGKRPRISAVMHDLEHALCDGIILYADHLRSHVAKGQQRKVFVANNTLFLSGYRPRPSEREAVLLKHGIRTPKNIIFIGRLQKRKRLEDLVKAFEILADERFGLVLVGPDEEKIAASWARDNPRIFTTGPLYGTDALDLLSACDVFCMPGAIGLSIVDAMYCGLPVVTERLSHGPEIMYLHDGANGFIVEKGDCRALAARLRLLLEDDELRSRFSRRAKEEIDTNGHIDNLCRGFLQSLDSLIGPA